MVNAAALPKTIALVIVGAGPPALTTYLLQKTQSMHNRFVVIDP